jgi:rSAM/selenodomain-associated transferase 1
VRPARIALAVMAKAPIAGEVKTRLCPPLRPAEAAALARCFLQDRVEQVTALGVADPVVSFAPAARGRELRALLPAGVRLYPQARGDLGARLDTLLTGLLAEGYAGAIALGTDTPTLPTAYLEEACAVLAAPDADVVLGPSEDGGYYLIGLRRPAPALFGDMPWSTAAVCAETLARAHAAGRRVRLLPPWFDVDRAPDLARLRAPAPSAAFAPRRTLAYLAALGR